MEFPNLRAEMARKGLKQKDVADALGVTERTVSSYLNGTTPITLDSAYKIRDELFPGQDIGYLFEVA